MLLFPIEEWLRLPEDNALHDPEVGDEAGVRDRVEEPIVDVEVGDGAGHVSQHRAVGDSASPLFLLAGREHRAPAAPTQQISVDAQLLAQEPRLPGERDQADLEDQQSRHEEQQSRRAQIFDQDAEAIAFQIVILGGAFAELVLVMNDRVVADDVAKAEQAYLPAEVEVLVIHVEVGIEQADAGNKVESEEHAGPGGVGDVAAIPDFARVRRRFFVAAEGEAESEEVDRVADGVERVGSLVEHDAGLHRADRRVGFDH